MISACIKKQGRSQINNLTLHLRELEKEEETEPEVIRRKEKDQGGNEKKKKMETKKII